MQLYFVGFKVGPPGASGSTLPCTILWACIQKTDVFCEKRKKGVEKQRKMW